jgi:hypothetical protein
VFCVATNTTVVGVFGDNRTLVSLNLANNNLRAPGAKHIAEALPKW